MDATAHQPRPPLHHRVPPTVRTVLPWVGVALFPVVLVLASTTGAPGGWSMAGQPAFPEADVVRLGNLGISLRYLWPALVVALPAGLLRRRPVLALTLMLVGSSLVTATVNSGDHDYRSEIWKLQFLAIDGVVGLIAASRPRRISVPAAGVTLVVQIGAAFLNPGLADAVARAELTVLAIATAWMIGNSVRARRGYAEALRSQATAQAATAERLRIARELHDMVAHSIGVIAIQAGVGSRVLDSQPAEARKALDAIETTSRETLAGLRRTLGTLRRTEPESGPRTAPLDPAPGLADLDRLAATTLAAGVRVDLRWRGRRRPVPADIDLSGYRIAQEAVTNVLRHSGARECQVTVDYGDEELSIEVDDDGPGCAEPGAGYGIVGMRERVGLLHGRFSAGPRPEGGFRVTARLPLPVVAGEGDEPGPVGVR